MEIGVWKIWRIWRLWWKLEFEDLEILVEFVGDWRFGVMESGDFCLLLSADHTQSGEFPLPGGMTIPALFPVGFCDFPWDLCKHLPGESASVSDPSHPLESVGTPGNQES